MECRVGGYKFLTRTAGKTSLMREHLREIALKGEEEDSANMEKRAF